MIDYNPSWDTALTGGVLSLLIIPGFLLIVAVQIAFAIGVYQEGRRLEKTGTGTELVEPIWWALATLVTGFVGVGMFWAIHFAPVLSRGRRPTTYEERQAALRNTHREE